MLTRRSGTGKWNYLDQPPVQISLWSRSVLPLLLLLHLMLIRTWSLLEQVVGHRRWMVSCRRSTSVVLWVESHQIAMFHQNLGWHGGELQRIFLPVITCNSRSRCCRCGCSSKCCGTSKWTNGGSSLKTCAEVQWLTSCRCCSTRVRGTGTKGEGGIQRSRRRRGSCWCPKHKSWSGWSCSGRRRCCTKGWDEQTNDK